MLEINKIYNIDYLEGIKQIEDKSIDLIVIDPPYRVQQGGNKTKAWQDRYASSILKNNDGKIFEHNNVNISDYMKEAYRVLKDSTHFYVFTDTKNMKDMIVEAENTGFYLHNILVWEKNNWLINRWYMKNVEFILFFKKRKSKEH